MEDPDHVRTEHSALMQTALDASLFAVVVLDASGRIIFCNELGANLLGLTKSVAEARAYDAAQFKHTDLDGGPWPDEKQPFVRVMQTGAAVRGVEHCIERPDGRVITLRINAVPIKNERGEIKLVVCSFEDISERRAIEEALRQTQKMEAIGRLAGGVAHDFNNLLTAILSYAAMARGELNDPASVLESLGGITEAAERAAALTRQLLAFARREVTRPTTFDARDEVAAAARLIARLLGQQVALHVELADRPCWLRMDANHLQQVLLNLAVNARDAMPEGGKLTLSVERSAHGSVRVRVSDTGVGMDEATQRKAFEPFFTTKPSHEGTGLGLSTCHGIVVQAGGRITLRSELGQGTQVEVELPLAEAVHVAAAARPAVTARPSKQSRILVVEDDPSVQRIAVRSLERAGYKVRASADAARALQMLQEESTDLILCDLVLPGMSGPDLIERVRASHPEIRVLFVSGYSNELARTGHDAFLAKPYAPKVLLGRVSEILEA